MSLFCLKTFQLGSVAEPPRITFHMTWNDLERTPVTEAFPLKDTYPKGSVAQEDGYSCFVLISEPALLFLLYVRIRASHVVLVVKNSPENAGDKRHGFDFSVGKIWRRAWQPTPVFLPGEAHEERSQVGYSPGGLKGSAATEAT